MLSMLVPLAAASMLTQQPTCTTTLVSAEDFDQGVLPSGWTNDSDWIFAPPPVCDVKCGSGFLATYFSTNCDCVTTSGGCWSGGDLSSSPIPLPSAGPGQKLVLDFCFEGLLDTGTGDSNQLEIEHALGVQTYKLGTHVFFACSGPSFEPPFDLTPYAGQTIRLTWHAGSSDPEGISA